MGTAEIDKYFEGKPTTQKYFYTIVAYAHTLGDIEETIKSQISYGVNRKFLWFWVYDKTPDGTLYMTVALDEKLEDPLFHYVNQATKNRWNHHIKVRSNEIANSDAVKRLVRAGYEFARK